MAFDQTTRNRLQRFVGDARALLSEEFTRQLQATYGLNPVTGDVADIESLSGLTPHQQETAQLLRDTLSHYLASNEAGKEKDRKLAALDRIVREQAFTVLNRIAALRMNEARGSLIESLANGYESKGFQLFHRIAGVSLGETGDAYRHYLFSIFDEFTVDLSVLFDRFSAQGRLFPSAPVLLELLKLVNDEEIAPLWSEDETIGWIYQYFNSTVERKKMRDASQAPRNSRELAVRNQFFTPRYVVEFLTDNTLGRIWYEMTQGKTSLIDSCEYLVRRPSEIFLSQKDTTPESSDIEGLSQEELLQQTVYVEYRALKDPRDIKMLDPACGSMHFGLYCFDLFEKIYEEAWEIECSQGPEAFIRENALAPLTEIFKDKTEFLTHVPRMIIENNIHGVDIDPRAAQVAALSLWQRAHNSWQQAGVKPLDRPQIRKSNIVCAEPMPGEKELLQEFTSTLKPTVLGQLVEVIFEKMELAGEAGTLLKIEKEIEDAIAGAKAVWQEQNQALSLFPDLAKVAKKRGELEFDVSDIDDEGFWLQAEQKILDALANYSSFSASEKFGQKQLFVADAARGFAFIGLCKKSFDVVLMNPPFGQGAKRTKHILERSYRDGKTDIAACFISRGRELLTHKGKLGCLATRLLLSLPSFEEWRLKEFLGKYRLSILADLGYGVLDAAVVEAAAYIQSRENISSGVFFDCLQGKNKEVVLKSSLTGDISSKYRFLDEFKLLPASVIAHFVSPDTIKKFESSDQLICHGVRAYKGINTSDDFRFVRLAWENTYRNKKDYWRPFAKGGEWNPFWDDTHLQVNWNRSGQEVSIAGGVIRNFKTQGNSGLTYPERTTSSFGPRILPKNTVYSSAGMGIFTSDLEDSLLYLAVLLSRQVQFVIEISLSGGDSSVSGTAARHYTNGMINRLPIPYFDGVGEEISSLTRKLVLQKRTKFSFDETTSTYNWDIFSESDVHEISRLELKETLESLHSQAGLLQKLDSLISEKFSYNELELSLVVGPNVWEYSHDVKWCEVKELYLLNIHELVNQTIEKFGDGARFITKNSQLLDRRIELISHILKSSPNRIIDCLRKNISDIPLLNLKENLFRKMSFKIGFRFNRWSSGLNYDSCFFDEPISLSFGESVDVLSICDVSSVGLNDKDIEYLRGIYSSNEARVFEDFFDFHLDQYSKSRRQAPVYWLISTTSGDFCLWIYFHAISNDTIYNAINNYVDPRIEEIKVDIDNQSSKKILSNLEKLSLDRLNNSLDELIVFKEDLQSLSKFWQPNLHDGVQITVAPLWRLFQHKPWQKKLKATWEKLEDGDYDWAHLAYTTWPKRVLQKCHTDRSLAIAHEVESDLWHEVEVIKGRKKQPSLEWQPKDLSQLELNRYIQDKIATDERLALYRSNNSGGKL